MKARVHFAAETIGDPRERRLTAATLPAPNGTRWIARRKAEVVTAVLDGVLSLDEACARYALSVEEFLSWQCLVARQAIGGARATGRRQMQGRDNHANRVGDPHRY